MPKPLRRDAFDVLAVLDVAHDVASAAVRQAQIADQNIDRLPV